MGEVGFFADKIVMGEEKRRDQSAVCGIRTGNSQISVVVASCILKRNWSKIFTLRDLRYGVK